MFDFAKTFWKINPSFIYSGVLKPVKWLQSIIWDNVPLAQVFTTDPISDGFFSSWTLEEQLHAIRYPIKTRCLNLPAGFQLTAQSLLYLPHVWKGRKPGQLWGGPSGSHKWPPEVCFLHSMKSKPRPEKVKDGILAFHASLTLIDFLLLMTTWHRIKIFKFKQWISLQDYRFMSPRGEKRFDVATFRHFPATALISATWLTVKTTCGFLRDASRKSILDFIWRTKHQLALSSTTTSPSLVLANDLKVR